MNEDHVKQNNCLSCLKNSKSVKSFLFVSYSALSSSCSVHRLLDCVPLPIRLTHVAAVNQSVGCHGCHRFTAPGPLRLRFPHR